MHILHVCFVKYVISNCCIIVFLQMIRKWAFKIEYAAIEAILSVQSPEYAEVNVTVECVHGSNEEARQPAAGLSTFPI